MKRIVLSVFAMVASLAAFAQLPVDSTVQNKNVILEEFTGIHCGYCPDGHKIANQIVSSNPGDVFVINIHTGGYATPNAGEPDFRTPFGQSLAQQSGLTGYPAGTVNRHVFSGSKTALSRGSWDAASNQILGQTSYVNMAMEAEIDLQTRQMIVDVQLYFTGSGAPANMNLNVAVNQNNVPGPQSGGSTNPDQMLPNGDYNHMHMLRHLITGQWGEVIDTTAQGMLIQRQYTYSIPADINGVPMNMAELEVVGFVAEGHQEIITGAKAVMSYITPPGISIADIKVESATTMPGLCDYSVDPAVKVINKGISDVDTFRVGYNLNGNGYIFQTITTTLPAGDSVVVTFPQETLPAGSNTLEFNANVDSTQHLMEMATADNDVEMETIYTMSATAFDTQIFEGFESYNALEAKPSNSIITGEADNAFVLNQTKVNGLNWPLGGHGNSENSYFFYVFNMSPGSSTSLVFEKLDFSGNTNTKITFDRAYAQYSSENDKLELNASTDCGSTWTTLFSKQGSALATAPATSNPFFPEANQWASETIDASQLDGNAEVILAFKVTSDYGNNMFLDNIITYDDNTVGARVNERISSLNIYPNPADNFVNVDLELAEAVDVNIDVINLTGQVVSTKAPGTMTTGAHNINLNTNELPAGIYTIRIKTGDKLSVERISIMK